MNEFDIKAAEWDMNAMHWARSEAIVEEIRKIIPLNKNMTALEYGAGTGIASFLLKEDLRKITLMDNSSEMVRVIKEKIEKSKAGNLDVINFDLEHHDYTAGKFDLIFTQMVLHHVDDIGAVIAKFGKLLNTGGYIAIADLYEEDGSFHGDGFTGHKGFDPEKLSAILSKNQFGDVAHRSCFIIDKEVSKTVTRQYPVFLLTARRY
jgi:tRNA (cmo5U34)-methyltransferase